MGHHFPISRSANMNARARLALPVNLFSGTGRVNATGDSLWWETSRVPAVRVDRQAEVTNQPLCVLPGCRSSERDASVRLGKVATGGGSVLR